MGLRNTFQNIFYFSFHINSYKYRTYHATGLISSFKTEELVAIQISDQKAWKLPKFENMKCMKWKYKRTRVRYLRRVAKGYPEQLGLQHIDIYSIYLLNDREGHTLTLLVPKKVKYMRLLLMLKLRYMR